MNYRHVYHAGNFADVLKHAALVFILEYLRKKETGFAVIDTHAGSGLYNLSGTEAQKTGEASEGISRLRDAAKADTRLPNALTAYLGLVAEFGERYPGSPVIAAKLLRPQDRLIAIEKHPEDVRPLRDALKATANARVIEGDGYQELVALLPPPERRGVILVDPPYESDDEWRDATSTIARSARRFATGIYCLWYPAKARGTVEAAVGELLHSGITRLLQVELDIGVAPNEPSRAEGQGPRLSATGLLVVNAPFGFAEAIEETLATLTTIFARGAGANGFVRRRGRES